jgi:hypothetical protein
MRPKATLPDSGNVSVDPNEMAKSEAQSDSDARDCAHHGAEKTWDAGRCVQFWSQSKARLPTVSAARR